MENNIKKTKNFSQIFTESLNLSMNMIKFILIGSFLLAFLSGIYSYYYETNEIISLISILLVLIVQIYYTIGVLKVVDFTYDKKKSNFSEVFKEINKTILPFFLTSFILTIFLLLLGLLLIIPAIIMGVFWTFVGAIIIHEKKYYINALNRSKEIVSKRWWKVFGYLILIGLVVGLTTYLISIPIFLISFLSVDLYSALANFISIVLSSFSMIFIYVFYRNLI